MSTKLMIVIGIALPTLFVLSVIFISQLVDNHSSTLNINLNNYSSLLYKTIPIRQDYVNSTVLTSIVSSTEREGNLTVIHLANGLSLVGNETPIQSGDSLEVRGDILKLVCSSFISSNQTLKNNTLVKVIVVEDPSCKQDHNIFKLTGWSKLNQK